MALSVNAHNLSRVLSSAGYEDVPSAPWSPYPGTVGAVVRRADGATVAVRWYSSRWSDGPEFSALEDVDGDPVSVSLKGEISPGCPALEFYSARLREAIEAA